MTDHFAVNVERREPLTEPEDLDSNTGITLVSAVTEAAARAASHEVFDPEVWKITNVEPVISSYRSGYVPSDLNRDDPDLAAVEQRYEFTFGTPDDHETAGAVRSMSVVCSNKDCERCNRPVELHDDTVLPVMCGGCGQVLHCLHEDTLPITHHEGDLANPRRITREVCVVCQTEVSRKVEPLPPIAVENIPLHMFAGLDIDAVATAASQASLKAAKATEGME